MKGLEPLADLYVRYSDPHHSIVTLSRPVDLSSVNV